MHAPDKLIAAVHHVLTCGVVTAIFCLAGCGGGMFLAGAWCTTTAPHLSRVEPPLPTDPAVDTPPDVETSCDAPPPDSCEVPVCPPFWSRHHLKWLHCLGPMFHRGQAVSLTETELYPPHSKFHPVPTAPVFAQRFDYEPPERMMEPVPVRPHAVPQPLRQTPNFELLPTPVEVLDRPVVTPEPAAPPRAGDDAELMPPPPPGQSDRTTSAPRSVLLLRQ